MFESVKNFYKKHKKKILTGLGIFGACAAGGAVGYCLTRDWSESKNDIVEDETEEPIEQEDPCAWNKDWDEMATSFELDTHQPLGSFKNGYTEEEGYVDPLEGNCFIIAGYNSYYNDSPDQLDFYVLDNEGYFHRMPDELRT